MPEIIDHEPDRAEQVGGTDVGIESAGSARGSTDMPMLDGGDAEGEFAADEGESDVADADNRHSASTHETLAVADETQSEESIDSEIQDARDLYENPEHVAHQRATELQGMLAESQQGRMTMGAGVIEDAEGQRHRIIGTSEENGYLRREVKSSVMESGDLVADGDTHHAEQNIVKYSEDNGYKVVAVGAGRPVCDECVTAIESSGGTVASPRRNP